MSGKTTADVCADDRCGHTRYNHDPSGGCCVDTNYYVPPCPCDDFKDAAAVSGQEQT